MQKKTSDKDSIVPSAQLAIMIALFPVAVVVADLLGRLRQLFLQEWPFIAWGMFILIVAAGLIFQFFRYEGYLDRISDHFKERHQMLEARLSEQAERLESQRQKLSNETDRLDKRMVELRSQNREILSQTREALSKLKELEAQKTPVMLSQVPAPTPDVEAAISDLVGA